MFSCEGGGGGEGERDYDSSHMGEPEGMSTKTTKTCTTLHTNRRRKTDQR